MNQETERSDPVIQLTNVSKTYPNRTALADIDLTVPRGQLVALIGPSGAGKSTLLRCISGLIPCDKSPTSRIMVNGDVVQENGRVSRHVRKIRSGIGFIFQQFNLVGRLPLITNVLVGVLSRLPLHRRQLRWFTQEEKTAAMRALDFVGMSEFAAQRASTMSGGQQQRGAIARAIVQEAEVILADEPIASLDPESARQVIQGLRRLNQQEGVTVLVSVHQVEQLASWCDRVIGLRDGRVVFDGPGEDLSEDRFETIYGTRKTSVAGDG